MHFAQSDWRIRVYISYQSDCCNELFILHKPITAYLAPIRAFTHCFLANVVMESGGLRESVVALVQDLLGLQRLAGNFMYYFSVKTCFVYGFFIHHAQAKQPTLSNTYCHNNVQSSNVTEHTQTLHDIYVRQFFTCLNCILPIKFHFATLDFAPSPVISLWITCI